MLQRIIRFLSRRGNRPVAPTQDPWDQAAIADWWETVHQKEELLWLTGSEPEHVWRFLGVATRMSPGQTVLNIGVGLGHDTRALHALGMKVCALDISPTALRRVGDVTEERWLASELERIPEGRFDWMLSYLVTQHMSDEDLRHQLTRLLPALRDDGVFAMQFADHPAKDENTRNTLPFQKGGGVCRTYDEMAVMIRECGGRIAWTSEPWVIEPGGAVFFAIHIMK